MNIGKESEYERSFRVCREASVECDYEDALNGFRFIIIIAEDPRFCKRRDECDSIFKNMQTYVCIFEHIWYNQFGTAFEFTLNLR